MPTFSKLFKTLPTDMSGTILHLSKSGQYLQTQVLHNLGIKPCHQCGHLMALEKESCHQCGELILIIKSECHVKGI